MSKKQFMQIYRGRFDVLDPAEIAEKYDGKILTSWEGYEDKEKTIQKFSHRHMIADWLIKNGFEVKELLPAPKTRKKGF